MITCRECGEQTEETVGYCPNCGSRLPYNEEGRRRFARILFTSCCLLLVIFGAIKAPGAIRDVFREWKPPLESESSDFEEEYQEGRWTEQVHKQLEAGELNSALEVIDRQIVANRGNAQLYETAGSILIEYNYPQEAAGIWLAGMEQTGERQFAVLLRENIHPAHLGVAVELADCIEDVIGKPLAEMSWEELGQIRKLHVMDSDTEAVSAAKGQDGESRTGENEGDDNGSLSIELALDLSDSAWGASELVLLYALEQLYWDSWVRFDIQALPVVPGLRHLRLQSFASSDLQVLAGMENLATLTLVSASLDSLDGISQMKQLRSLELGNTAITTLAPLSGLPELERLVLTGDHQLASAAELAGLTGLRELVLEGGDLLEMQALAGLQQLESLTLRQAAIKDISFVAELPVLRSLTLENNSGLANLRPIGGAQALEQLHLDTGAIDSLEELAQLQNLQSLYLSGLRDLQPLSSLQELRTLVLKGVSAHGDLRALAGLGQLESLTMLDVSSEIRQPEVLYSLSGLKQLELSGVRIYESMDRIASLTRLEELSIQSSMIQLSLADLSGLDNLEKLTINDSKLIHNVTIRRHGPVSHIYYDDLAWEKELANWNAPPQISQLSLTGNGLTQLDFVAKLPQLTELNLAGNSITHLKPLQQLTQLRRVNLIGNPILDADAVQEMEQIDILL